MNKIPKKIGYEIDSVVPVSDETVTIVKTKSVIAMFWASLVACLAIAALLIYAIGFYVPKHGGATPVTFSEVIFLALFIGFLFLCLRTAYRVVSTLPEEIVVLSPTGFTDFRVSKSEIPWDTVTSIKTEKAPVRPFTSIFLDTTYIRIDQEMTAAEKSIPPIYTASIGNSSGLPKVTYVVVIGLKIDAASLSKLFQKYFAKYSRFATRQMTF